MHVSDLADLTDLLQGGELVLTTGSAMLADPVGYLEGLAATGAVGVIAELLDAEVPQTVAATADRLGLPVVVLRRTIRFVEVTEEVHRSIVADQYEEVVFSRHVHEVFTGLGMRRAGVSEIVSAAAELIGRPVVLEDLTRQVLAFDGRGGPPAELLRDWNRRSRLTPSSRETAVTGPEGWLVSPVGGTASGMGAAHRARPRRSRRPRADAPRTCCAGTGAAPDGRTEQDRTGDPGTERARRPVSYTHLTLPTNREV